MRLVGEVGRRSDFFGLLPILDEVLEEINFYLRHVFERNK